MSTEKRYSLYKTRWLSVERLADFFYKTNIFDSWFESIRAASDFVVKCI